MGSEKKALKEKGLEFVQEVYDVLWSFIYNCIAEKRPLLNQYKSEFPLFTEICSELIRSIDEMNVEEVEKRLKFDNLADSVLRAAIWLRYNKDNEVYDKEDETKFKKYEYNYQSEISELNSFAKYIGYYLEKQNNKNNIINQRVWANVLNRWSLFSTYSLLGAIRETKEEVGVDLMPENGQVLFIKTRKIIDGKIFNDIMDVWLFEYDGEVDLGNATTDEVAQVAWMNREQIKELFDANMFVDTLEYFFTEVDKK